VTPEGNGTVRFEWLLATPPKTRAEARQLKKDALRIPMLKGSLVTENGRAVAIYVPLKSKKESYRIAGEIKEAVGKWKGDEQYFVTGLPVAEDTFGVQMFVQMAISAPLAALVIFIIMWWFFRSLPLIAAPMIIAMSTVIITMGALIGLGFTVHIMSSMIPIFLMPIAVVNSIHILSEFSDTYSEGKDKREVISHVISKLFTPMFYTSLTTIAGFGSLAFAPIPPVKVFGAFVATGVAISFFLSVIFIPAYVVSLSDKTLSKLPGSDEEDLDADESKATGMLGKLLPKVGRFAVGHSVAVVMGLVVISAISAYGIMQININDNPVRWFEEKHELRIADKELNKHFAGTYPAYLVLNKKGKDPETMLSEAVKKAIASIKTAEKTDVAKKWKEINAKAKAKSFDQRLTVLIEKVDNILDDAEDEKEAAWNKVMKAIEGVQGSYKYFLSPEGLAYVEKLQGHLHSLKVVGKSNSLADIVKTLNRDLHDGKTSYYKIPKSSAAVSQALLTYESSHRPHDLWHFVTSDYRKSSIWVQLKSGDNQNMVAVVDSVAAFAKNNPPPAGVELKWAGMTYLNVVWQKEMVAGMMESLIGSFVIVLIMMIILFRSLLFGLLSMIPLSITIAFIYGAIGLIGKDYDMPVAVLSAMTLGLSVDFAIHFLQRARKLHQELGDWTKTLRAMFQGPGRAITRNAIVIAIGFLPLLAAPLVPYNTVGFFMAAIMAVSGVVTLVLLPAVVNLLQRFLRPLKKSKSENDAKKKENGTAASLA
jgi:predicted RND superfamily exporter protein